MCSHLNFFLQFNVEAVGASIKNDSKNATLPFKKTSDDIFQGYQKQQTDTINKKFFGNASSPVFTFFSKIIRFYFIEVFPDFLDTLYRCDKYFGTGSIIIDQF
jgi:hypothetical protein